MKPDGASRVSTAVKTTVLLGLAGAALLIWYLRRDHEPAPATAAPTTAAGGAAAKARPPDHVQRVTATERKQLAAQIQNARSRAVNPSSTTSAPAGPSLPATPRPSLPTTPTLDDAETVRTSMRAAMKEVIPFLAECYDKHGSGVPDEVKVVAKLSLTGDPDVGTLIDTNGLADEGDNALPAEFDLCLRDSLAGLQLPPLAEGTEFTVTYPFLFTR